MAGNELNNGLFLSGAKKNKQPGNLSPDEIILNNLGQELARSNEVREATRIEYESRFMPMVYNGKPFIYDLLAAKRRLPPLLKRVYQSHRTNPNPVFDLNVLESYERSNIFPMKLGGNIFRRGTSLEDIEQMALVDGHLSVADTSRIDRMFRQKFDFFPVPQAASQIRESLIYLAVQRFSRPDLDLAPPQELIPLQDRLIAYYDSYINLMKRSTVLSLDSDELGKAFSLRPKLGQDLSIYIPARLGITPASTRKLFVGLYRLYVNNERLVNRGLKSLMEEVDLAAYPKNLSEDLKPYEKYDPTSENRAEDWLNSTYREKSEMDQVTSLRRSQELLERLKLYRKVINSTIKRARARDLVGDGKDRFSLALDHELGVSEAVVTSQYPHSLMFVLMLNDAHLTLDLNYENGLYGIPGKTAASMPNLDQLLLRDILSPLLEKLKSLFPIVESKPATPVYLSSPMPTRYISSIPDLESGVPITVQEPKETVKPKVKSTGSFAKTLTSMLQRAVEPVEEPKQQHFVAYDRDKIAKKLPAGTHDKVIDDIMNGITSFEFGRGNAIKVAKIPGWWRVKVGKWRIILAPDKNNQDVFYIQAIPQRKDLEKTLSNLNNG